ncbi:hypothetical protein GBA52_009746 [Prunus armeniaca]|nr:hypothetical protein GBA52_009746 [Prunus armeniaca]
MWMKEEGFEEIVKEAWNNHANRQLAVTERLKRISKKSWRLYKYPILQNSKSRERTLFKRKLMIYWENRKSFGNNAQGWNG